jgi:hypothetical protein
MSCPASKSSQLPNKDKHQTAKLQSRAHKWNVSKNVSWALLCMSNYGGLALWQSALGDSILGYVAQMLKLLLG